MLVPIAKSAFKHGHNGSAVSSTSKPRQQLQAEFERLSSEMARSEETTLTEVFRILLHRIAIQLTPQNCHGLRFLINYSISNNEQHILGLDILDELITRETITPLKLSGLERLLCEINRQDLVDLIKEYKKRDEFKSVEKQVRKKAGKKPSVKKFSVDDDMLPSTLLTAAHLNSHMWSLVDTATRTRAMCKKEVTALAEVKKDYEKLRKSLKKAIVVLTEKKVTEERATALEMNLSVEELPSTSKLDKKKALLSISTPNLVHSTAQ